jgi:hypothetical protein
MVEDPVTMEVVLATTAAPLVAMAEGPAITAAVRIMAAAPAITAEALAVMAVHLVTMVALQTMVLQPLAGLPPIAHRQAVPAPKQRKSNG